MNYEEFKVYAKDNIARFLPEEYSNANIEIAQVMKNNSIELYGLNIRKEGADISPNIYLDKFFNDYKSGKDLNNIMEELAALRVEHEKEAKDIVVDNIKDFESIKEKITCRVVNGERNEILFQSVPHKRIYDLGITYHIDLGNNDFGYGSIRIMNSLMEEWNKSLKEIHDIALENTIKNYPAEFTSMSEVIMGMMKDELLGEFLTEVSGEELDFMKEEFFTKGESEEVMYVLTNQSKFNGATVMIYPEVLNKIGERLGKDYYILPSSLHELIIVPKLEGTHVSDLEKMIKEVNSTEVMPDDFLADHPYEFSRELEKLTPVYGDDHYKMIVSAEGYEDKMLKVPKQKAMER